MTHPIATAALRRAPVAAAALLALVAAPAPVAAHTLTGRFASPLPLELYLAGAAIAVALSFGLVLTRDRQIRPPAPDGRLLRMPGWLRVGLRGAGLLGWAWALGGSLLVEVPGDADPGSLFLWVYGWVGLALVSALLGPAWSWLDPFSMLADLIAAVGRRLGLRPPPPARLPDRLRRWPAVAGYAFFVWLELAVTGGGGGRLLGLGLLGYTAVTLGAMLVYGRETWRRDGETFSVWFELLGRLAPLTLAGPPSAGTLRLRRYGAGLLRADWIPAEVALVALAAASVIFDGLSQTDPWFRAFGPHTVLGTTLQLAAFTAIIVSGALLTTRLAGTAAVGAGLIPIAAGYIVAHYLTFILVDGQRIALLLDDPLGHGWHLLGLQGWEPSGAWLPPALVWTVMVGAVVGGHVFGALTGHTAAALEVAARARPSGPRGPRPAPPATVELRAADFGQLRRRQVPLACLMVGLTVLTLWSLGQIVVRPAG